MVTSSISGVKFQQQQLGDKIILATSSNKLHGNCGYDTLEASKTYMMSFELSRQSNSSYTFTALESNKASGLDILTNTSHGIAYTQMKSMQSKTTCIDQMFYVLDNPKRFVNLGNQTCDVVKIIVVRGGKDSSIIAVLGKNSNNEPRLNIYLVHHPFGSSAGNSTLVQTIVTYHARDVISMVTEDGSFIAVINTYDSSEGSLTVSYTVPVFIFK